MPWSLAVDLSASSERKKQVDLSGLTFGEHTTKPLGEVLPLAATDTLPWRLRPPMPRTPAPPSPPPPIDKDSARLPLTFAKRLRCVEARVEGEVLPGMSEAIEMMRPPSPRDATEDLPVFMTPVAASEEGSARATGDELPPRGTWTWPSITSAFSSFSRSFSFVTSISRAAVPCRPNNGGMCTSPPLWREDAGGRSLGSRRCGCGCFKSVPTDLFFVSFRGCKA
mmetsp:Transcript_18216/g.36733  ORF Transcript_18216/g.36733 Transcript_18216/m.36733 type:complete len:224 (-) Transcript_18216:6640-7311(-)